MDSDSETSSSSSCSISESSEDSPRCLSLSKTPEANFCLAKPKNVVGFWRDMAKGDSPLLQSHPIEHRCYSLLSCCSEVCLAESEFLKVMEAGLGSCLSVGGHRKADRRSILVGKALCDLLTNLDLRYSLVSLLEPSADFRLRETDACVSSIVAYTVNHLWSCRHSATADDSDSDAAEARTQFPELSVQEEERTSYN